MCYYHPYGYYLTLTTATSSNPKTWAAMTLSERIKFAEDLIGQDVRYVTKADYEAGQAVSPEWPLKWREATLTSLEPVEGKAYLRVDKPSVILGWTFPYHQDIAFDELQLLEPLPDDSVEQE